MYKSSQDCLTDKVMIGRCEGHQIYDTSTCIDCNSECVGASGDPRRKGQYIKRECSQSTMDYVSKPCLWHMSCRHVHIVCVPWQGLHRHRVLMQELLC